MLVDYQKHWANIYQTKALDNVSWYQTRPDVSLNLIQQTGIGLDEAIIDVGAGASTLVDYLVEAGYQNITLLDISADALAITRARLGAAGERIHWLTGDITAVELPREGYAVWHDRAVFHFLTDPSLQQRYVEQVRRALKPGGQVVIATFAPTSALVRVDLPVLGRPMKHTKPERNSLMPRPSSLPFSPERGVGAYRLLSRRRPGAAAG